MADIFGIIKKNNDTFYDFRNGRHISVRYRLFFYAISAILLAYCCGSPATEITSAVITIESILIGFGFSVLFFLASSGKDHLVGEVSLESKQRAKRLNQLSVELFSNISYYNLISILSLLLSLIFLVPPVEGSHVIFPASTYFTEQAQSFLHILIICANFIFLCMQSLYYFILFESTFTFIRIILRVNFYFDQKRPFTQT